MSQSLQEKILSRMQELGIEPKRSLGQNFLVSDNVVNKIIAAADPSSFSSCIEVGPGLGALTDHLLSGSPQFEVVELDKTFSQYWLSKGLKVTEADALKFDWQKFVAENPQSLLVSNLPYQISSRLVVDMSLLNPSFQRMVLMFQKEVAQRIMAQEATENYGLLTVVAQVFWTVRLVLEAGAVDFMPKPNVASRVLCFERKPQPPIANPKDFLNFIKTCFTSRRKKLMPKLKIYQDKQVAAEIFQSLGLKDDVRAEKLSPQQFVDLYLALRKG